MTKRSTHKAGTKICFYLGYHLKKKTQTLADPDILSVFYGLFLPWQHYSLSYKIPWNENSNMLVRVEPEH